MRGPRCSRCDHPIEYCECLTGPKEWERLTPHLPSLAADDLFIDVGLGRPVIIRSAGTRLSAGLVVAFLLLPAAFVLLPFLGALAFSGMDGGLACWHQVAGFLGGILLAAGLALATPYLLLRLSQPRSRWTPQDPEGATERFRPQRRLPGAGA